MASPGILQPLLPNVWKVDLLWEMGPVVFAENIFSCIYSTDRQRGISVFGKIEAGFLIVSINIVSLWWAT